MNGVVQGSDGAFYGTTSYGGPQGGGTVFKIDAGGTFTLLASFTDVIGQGALIPSALVEGNDGAFYGTAYAGGFSANGTIFRIDAAGTFTLLHSFNSPDGSAPQDSLVVGTDGALYGATPWGGRNGQGVVFRLTPN